MSSGPVAYLSRHRDFARYWVGMSLVTLGSQIESVAIGWQVYTLARATNTIEESLFLVGMVGLAQFLPLFALTLFAGSLADRMSRHAIVLVALATETLGVIGLTFVALQTSPSLTAIFTIAALFGVARAFLSPAASALVPMLVPRADMPQAISLTSVVWQLGVIVGPWIGGLLIAMSNAAAYAVTALMYAAGIAALLTIRQNTTPERQPGSQLALIKEGLVYVWQNRIVFGAISLDLVAVLLGGATALLPAFATDILKVGPQGFGLLRSGPAIGALLVALALARWPIKRDRKSTRLNSSHG